MTSRLGRGLRRFVDSLQRGLFDDAPEPVASAPAPDPLLRRPDADREIDLGGQRIGYRLARVRRRSIGFVVDSGGLAVRAPQRVSLREIDAALREKQGWILARLAEQRERAVRVAAARIVWRDGAQVDYLGRPLTIVLAGSGAAGAAGTTELVTGPHDAEAASEPWLRVALPRDAGEERVRDAVQSWLQREARRVFAERAAHFAALLGVRVRRLSLSSAATRWGSANADGSVRLHWRLIQHPPATIDYVVAHELAHLREMNHSARFWEVVRSVVPDYERARASLREAGRAEA